MIVCHGPDAPHRGYGWCKQAFRCIPSSAWRNLPGSSGSDGLSGVHSARCVTIACCCNVVDDLLQRLIIKNGLRVPSHVRKARYASGCRHSLADKSSGLRGGGLVHRFGFDWITMCLVRDLTGKRSRSIEINFADSGYSSTFAVLCRRARRSVGTPAVDCD